LLAKSLRPPPDKYHGLEDVELRYRHRELDLIANPEVRELFEKRARAVAAVREWLNEHGFLEVETPVLQPLYGGALARPFTTHHNALDRDLYLRIATELYLKRCVIGGIERVYELGKDFRNEGVSPKHNPEFTMVEWYEAYADYTDAAERLEQLVAHAAERVLGTTRVQRDGMEIDLAPPWRRVTLRDAIEERTGLDLAKRPSREELAAALGSEPDPAEGWGKLVDDLCRSGSSPSWLIRPCARLPGRAVAVRQEPPLRGGAGGALGSIRRRDRDRQRVHGAQRPGRAAAPPSSSVRASGDPDAQPFDEAFLEALEYGCRPRPGSGWESTA
jgi:lysyl-tRNA synthetase class 2